MPKRPNLNYPSSHTEPPAPLALILEAMHAKYEGGDLEGTVALARIAAPYLHPRVRAATQATDLSTMPDADLDALEAPE